MKLLLIPFLSFSLLTHSQIKEFKNDLDKEGLKGTIKRIKTLTYRAKEHFGEINKGELVNDMNHVKEFNKNGNYVKIYIINPDYSEQLQVEYEYNDMGVLIRRLSYDALLGSKTIDNYDSNGNLLESNVISITSNKTISRISYTYNNQGFLEESKDFLFAGNELKLTSKTIFKNDEHGRNIEWRKYFPNGSLQYFYQYTYYENGQKESETLYNNEGKISTKHTYKYNDKSQLVEQSLDLGLENSKTVTTNEFDIIGNIIKEVRYKSNGDINYITSYEYKYDQNNNWTEKITYVNYIPIWVTIREIYYY